MGRTTETQMCTDRNSNKKELNKIDSLAGFNALTGGKLKANKSVGTILRIGRAEKLKAPFTLKRR